MVCKTHPISSFYNKNRDPQWRGIFIVELWALRTMEEEEEGGRIRAPIHGLNVRNPSIFLTLLCALVNTVPPLILFHIEYKLKQNIFKNA